MVFSSIEFLFFFLPFTVLIYYILLLTNKRLINSFLLFVSVFFYAWGAPFVTIPLILSTYIDYLLSAVIKNSLSQDRRKLALATSVILNISLLGYYKYANFFVDNLNSLLEFLNLAGLSWSPVLLPIGISFFTFHKISYVVDVYRRTSNPTPNFRELVLYVMFFPQLIAGPIVRYHDIAPQIRSRKHSYYKFISGFYRFSLGLGMKVLIADSLAEISDSSFNNLSVQSSTTLLLATVCYSLQIYFDFAGYSAMAMGLGKMFGFHFLENFRRPYISKSITEFWRRWHLSLSRFMKEYLYIPLGGSRKGNLRTYLNLWIVFIISGLWHGASFNFLFWGIYQGFFLVIERLGLNKITKRLPYILQTIICFFIVVNGWVLFRLESLEQSLFVYSKIYSFSDLSLKELASNLSDRKIFILLLAGVISFYPKKYERTLIKLYCSLKRNNYILFSIIGFITAISILLLSTASLISSSYHPFIYFRF